MKRPALVAADGTRIGWPSRETPADVARIAKTLSPNKSEAAAFLHRQACQIVAEAAPADREYFATIAAHLVAIADCIEGRGWRRGPADWQRATAINVLASTIGLRAHGQPIEQTCEG